jgi:hypothetical protein
LARVLAGTSVSDAAARVAAAVDGPAPSNPATGDPGGRRHGHPRQDHDHAADRPHGSHGRLSTGWSSTDGVFLDGVCVEHGD